EMTAYKNYVAPFTKQDIVIDGKAHEAIWDSISFTSNFVDIKSIEIPSLETKTKILWDHKNIYFYIEMEDDHIWSNMTEKDGPLHNENTVEIFIDPNDDGENYIEIQINPNNTLLDLKMDKPYRKGGEADINFDLRNIRHAVCHKGSINNNLDEDSFWSIELSVPFAALKSINTLSKIGNSSSPYLRMNLCRVHWPFIIEDGKYKKDVSKKPKFWVWQKQKKIDNHIPEDWGYLHFSKALLGIELDLSKNEDQN
ncbi:MAG: carbohydrate-binding family 9-like protein, partial [Saprospiraceae bacterium]|nr:carbohydrate-binding family 9-like protein [Saprospiraceae bacterium]